MQIPQEVLDELPLAKEIVVSNQRQVHNKSVIYWERLRMATALLALVDAVQFNQRREQSETRNH